MLVDQRNTMSNFHLILQQDALDLPRQLHSIPRTNPEPQQPGPVYL